MNVCPPRDEGTLAAISSDENKLNYALLLRLCIIIHKWCSPTEETVIRKEETVIWTDLQNMCYSHCRVYYLAARHIHRQRIINVTSRRIMVVSFTQNIPGRHWRLNIFRQKPSPVWNSLQQRSDSIQIHHALMDGSLMLFGPIFGLVDPFPLLHQSTPTHTMLVLLLLLAALIVGYLWCRLYERSAWIQGMFTNG